MNNETLRDKIASCVRDYDGYNGNSEEVSDDILATIKADNDAKDKRIEELEALVHKLASDPDYTAAYVAGVADQKATIAELEAKLAKAEAFIQSCVGGSVYSAVDSFAKPHEPETSRLARATLAELEGTTNEQ